MGVGSMVVVNPVSSVPVIVLFVQLGQREGWARRLDVVTLLMLSSVLNLFRVVGCQMLVFVLFGLHFRSVVPFSRERNGRTEVSDRFRSVLERFWNGRTGAQLVVFMMVPRGSDQYSFAFLMTSLFEFSPFELGHQRRAHRGRGPSRHCFFPRLS